RRRVRPRWRSRTTSSTAPIGTVRSRRRTSRPARSAASNSSAPPMSCRSSTGSRPGMGRPSLSGEQGASTNSGHRIQLVVHSLDDGSILSTVTTTTDIVGEKSWVRGQAGERAYIGPYLFDLRSGLLLTDVSSRDVHLSEPRGNIVP